MAGATYRVRAKPHIIREQYLLDQRRLLAGAAAFFAGVSTCAGRHGRDVYEKMAQTRLFDADTLKPFTSPLPVSKSVHARGRANALLAAVALYHPLSTAALKRAHTLPPILRHEGLLGEMEGFALYRDIDTAPNFDRQAFINFVEDPNLGLLVRIADLACSHLGAHNLEHLTADHPLLYRYPSSSEEDLKMILARAAWSGRWVYAPLAEALGYPLLAGDLYQSYFDGFHTPIKKSLAAFKENPLFGPKLVLTQDFATGFILQTVMKTLELHGIEAECMLRPVKHDGKLLGKAERLLVKGFQCSSETSVSPIFQPFDRSGFAEKDQLQFSQAVVDHVTLHAGTFAWEELHDWVALQVIVKRINGVSLTRFVTGKDDDPDINDPAYRDAIKPILEKVGTFVAASIDMALLRGGKRGMEHTYDTYDKPNGYLAVQFDFFTPRASLETMPFLPFEVQIHDDAVYRWINQGDAAHYLYLGGEGRLAQGARELIEKGALAALRHGLKKNK